MHLNGLTEAWKVVQILLAMHLTEVCDQVGLQCSAIGPISHLEV